MKKANMHISQAQIFIASEQNEEAKTLKEAFQQEVEKAKADAQQLSLNGAKTKDLLNIYLEVLESKGQREVELQTRKIQRPEAIINGIQKL